MNLIQLFTPESNLIFDLAPEIEIGRFTNYSIAKQN